MVFRVIFLLLFITGCSNEEAEVQVTEVVTDSVQALEYFPKRSFVGRLNAQEDVQIKARISGYLTSVDFKEGENVKVDDPLYSIDPREFEAALASARARLAAAQADRQVSDLNFRRGEELLPKKAISQADFDSLKAKKLEADAGYAQAEAAVKTAEVNLTFTQIKAPISGRIGRSAATVGDLVGPTSGVLTTLVSMDPIEAIFQISESTFVATSEERLGTNEAGEVELSDIQVGLELTNRQMYPLKGYIDYFANRIDDDTGTMETRALIPNPEGLLVPGQYVRVVLQLSNPLTGTFIPQSAVQADQQGSFVLVIEPGNVVARRNVELGDRVDADIRVLSGLDIGEEVIVRGLQLVRPGQVVDAKSVADAEA
ncbi:MAG: efflux RND transporter periplasmic adaptor subunit [Pseudomonadales bacterium]|nr:efflux RND transporter periplasmic adaptor subunit [Pseudomonadales bacterium]MBO6657697.1 efflux RND transporter periplasmic adaptor subunit [Pseudomonadales bacterium]MBO6703635.1 efflux RND transporter periplasmic adaptor subunit [Pseudomonadales bacterium]MBO7004308.1 efflux RND transporter periplasmic adaptor subunit [Pseudomonadales bacterium]